LGQSLSVALEAAKLAHLNEHHAIALLNYRTGADLGLVNVQAYNAPVDRFEFHNSSPLTKNTTLQCVLSPRGTAIQRSVRTRARRLFLTCAVHHLPRVGARQSGVRVNGGGSS